MSDSSPFKMRLVHLDLKGAPPKVSYLSEIFPLFHALGANALLIEYEDMFPYEGPLRLLRAKHAYSPSEIQEILHLARLNELEVVPLVQTFGHMEFVLKHRAFAHLREVASFPNTLNPHEAESLALVGAMLGQVLELHRGARWLHIGCDEVYYLGEGETSRQWLQQERGSKAQLCLSHVKAVVSHLLARHPATRPLLWDDMLRDIPEDGLAGSGVPPLVEPVLWDYGAELDVPGKALLIEKYQRCSFPGLWAASAFKGATGANQALTPIDHHLRNHEKWLQVARAAPPGALRGIVLTGWQRWGRRGWGAAQCGAEQVCSRREKLRTCPCSDTWGCLEISEAPGGPEVGPAQSGGPSEPVREGAAPSPAAAGPQNCLPPTCD